jgi:hypothetical protein
MFSALRFTGLLIVHTAIAVIVTAIAKHAIWKLVPAHSVVGVLWKESILGALCAACIGFGLWRAWRTSAAKWTWVLASPWFVFGLLMRHGDVFGNLFPLHSGGVLAASDARSFFAFTVPLICTIFYSLGAYIASVVGGGVTRTQAA